MRVKPYIVRARRDVTITAKPVVYYSGASCGLRFFAEKDGAKLHDTGVRFHGRDPEAMAMRGAHFILSGERQSGGREGL